MSTNKFGHLALVLFVTAINFIVSTSASPNCKMTVMKIMAQQCFGSGARERREIAPSGFHLQEIEPDAEITISEQRYPSKRQLDPTAFTQLATPLLTTAMAATANAVSSSYGSYGSGMAKYSHPLYPYPYPIASAYPGAPQYYFAAAPPLPPAAYPESKFPRGILPQATGANLGFDLTVEEVDEIFKIMSWRTARNSDEVKDKKIIADVAKCCINEELCRKQRGLITCPRPSND